MCFFVKFCFLYLYIFLTSVPACLPLRCIPSPHYCVLKLAVTGRFVDGQFVAGQFVAGQFVAGQFVAEHFIARQFVEQTYRRRTIRRMDVSSNSLFVERALNSQPGIYVTIGFLYC